MSVSRVQNEIRRAEGRLNNWRSAMFAARDKGDEARRVLCADRASRWAARLDALKLQLSDEMVLQAEKEAARLEDKRQREEFHAAQKELKRKVREAERALRPQPKPNGLQSWLGA